MFLIVRLGLEAVSSIHWFDTRLALTWFVYILNAAVFFPLHFMAT